MGSMLGRVQVGEYSMGGFGGSCRKAAHAQAGADVAVLHLQRYADMQVEAPGL